MCWEGLVDEALSIVRAVRLRYTGKVRNPWNECECGSSQMPIHFFQCLVDHAAFDVFRHRHPQ